MAKQNRRDFFRDLLRQGAKTLAAFEQGREEGRQKADRDAFFRSYESSYAMTLCEDELLLESAQSARHRDRGPGPPGDSQGAVRQAGRSVGVPWKPWREGASKGCC